MGLRFNSLDGKTKAIGKTSLWLITAALTGAGFVLCAAIFLNGSLEEFPTEEQHGKVVIAAGIGLILLCMLAAKLVQLLFVHIRQRKCVPHP